MNRALSLAAALARVAALGAVLAGVALSLLLHHAHAELDMKLANVGGQLMDYPGFPAEEERALHLNGSVFHFRSQTVEASFHEVLDHHRSECNGNDGMLAEELVAPFEDPALPSTHSLVESLAMTEARDDARGFVACVDLGSRSIGLRTLVERLARLVRTGSLGELGVTRYAYAEAIRNDRDKALVLTMWTEDLKLFDLMIREGVDAQGEDIPWLPRPPGSHRLMSAWEADAPTGIVAYTSQTMLPEQVVAFYRGVLEARGWSIVDAALVERTSMRGESVLAAGRDDQIVTVVSNLNGRGESVSVLLVAGSP